MLRKVASSRRRHPAYWQFADREGMATALRILGYLSLTVGSIERRAGMAPDTANRASLGAPRAPGRFRKAATRARRSSSKGQQQAQPRCGVIDDRDGERRRSRASFASGRLLIGLCTVGLVAPAGEESARRDCRSRACLEVMSALTQRSSTSSVQVVKVPSRALQFQAFAAS